VIALQIESSQSFVVDQECQKVAWQNGYRRALGEADGWARYGSTTAKADYPSETFRVLKEKEIRHYGEYSTHRLVLAAWDRMEADDEFAAMGM
jgi:hypothetical protein